MQKQTFDQIPGLLVYPDYFSETMCASLVQNSLAMHSQLEDAAKASQVETAHIPQPEFVRSERHNLGTEESYVRATIVEGNECRLKCEYFPKYGEEGHSLGYFRGNDNIPDFVREGLLDSIWKELVEAHLAPADSEMTWKLTMNFYKNLGGTVAGFPFHVDIPANGIVTMILNVQREVLFQITNGEEITDVPLPVGSLLVLSGESRYVWKHRVLPMASCGAVASGSVERVSLVLGFQ